jgi:hypothetical protein
VWKKCHVLFEWPLSTKVTFWPGKNVLTVLGSKLFPWSKIVELSSVAYNFQNLNFFTKLLTNIFKIKRGFILYTFLLNLCEIDLHSDFVANFTYLKKWLGIEWTAALGEQSWTKINENILEYTKSI